MTSFSQNNFKCNNVNETMQTFDPLREREREREREAKGEGEGKGERERERGPVRGEGREG